MLGEPPGEVQPHRVEVDEPELPLGQRVDGEEVGHELGRELRAPRPDQGDRRHFVPVIVRPRTIQRCDNAKMINTGITISTEAAITRLS